MATVAAREFTRLAAAAQRYLVDADRCRCAWMHEPGNETAQIGRPVCITSTPRSRPDPARALIGLRPRPERTLAECRRPARDPQRHAFGREAELLGRDHLGR